MTEDELTTLLLANRSKINIDPAICRIAARHILAFMADLTDAQRESVMNGFDALLGEIDMLESMAKRPTPRRSIPQAAPKPKAFDKFVNFITLDWLV